MSISKAGVAYNLDALDPLFKTLSDAYMKTLIAEFGTDHYYQADGFFNSVRGPWLDATPDVSQDEISDEISDDSATSPTSSPVRTFASAVTSPTAAPGSTPGAPLASGASGAPDAESGAPDAESVAFDPEASSLPPCTFSALPINHTYVPNTPTCPHTPLSSFLTLSAAEHACQACSACAGITYQTSDGCRPSKTHGCFTLREGPGTLKAPTGEDSTSWVVTNHKECRPPPSSTQAYKAAHAHSTAAFAGLTRTDPAATWVRL